MLFVFDFCLCSFHFWPLYNFFNDHVEAQKCVSTMPDARTKNSNTFWIISSDLGVLLAYIILLISDSCMNIDFLMNCFHSWFSLILLCSSFCFFWASLVWHMFESQFTMNKNERRHKSGMNITKFILDWILYWKFVVHPPFRAYTNVNELNDIICFIRWTLIHSSWFTATSIVHSKKVQICDYANVRSVISRNKSII